MNPELYAAIRTIKQIVIAAYTDQDVWIAPRDESPNPFYHQTATGLILATCIRESKRDSMGPTPALYTIARVEGHTLPTYTPRAHEDFVEYSVAKVRWSELVAG